MKKDKIIKTIIVIVLALDMVGLYSICEDNSSLHHLPNYTYTSNKKSNSTYSAYDKTDMSTSNSSSSSKSSSSYSSGSSENYSYSNNSSKSNYNYDYDYSYTYDSYDDGYDAIYMDGDYDYDRYEYDSEYADGVDDAMDELGEDW